MVGMKLREKEEVVQTTEKSKTFGAVSAITTEAKHDDEQVESGVTGNQEKTTSLELGDLMAKLEQTVKKLKCSEEDRQMLKKQIRYNKNENLDNCFNLARATEEKLQQMSEKVEATDKERERHQKRHAGNETMVRNCKRKVVEPRDEKGHNEQRQSRKFMCYTVQTGCSLRKLYSAREAGNG